MEIHLEQNMFEILQDLEASNELISSECIPRLIKDFYCKIKNMKNKKIFSEWLIRTERIIKNVTFMTNVLVFLMQKYGINAIFVEVVGSYRMEDHFLDFMLVASRQQTYKTNISIELKLPLKISFEICKQIIGKYIKGIHNNNNNNSDKDNNEKYMFNYNEDIDALVKRFDRLKMNHMPQKSKDTTELNTEIFLNDLGAEKEIPINDLNVEMCENGTIQIISTNVDAKKDSKNYFRTSISDDDDDNNDEEEKEEENKPFGNIFDV